MAINLVDHRGDLALSQKAIDQAERDFRATRQNISEIHPARSRDHDRAYRITFFVNRIVARFYPRIKRDRFRRDRVLYLAKIRETRQAVGLKRA